MKITSTGGRITVTRKFDITEDHPVIDQSTSYTGKKVRIERGSIEFEWTDGNWRIGPNNYLHGTVLKKDGSDSLNSHAEHPRCEIRSGDFSGKHAWLQPIADLLRPTGEIRLALLHEHEVQA